MGMQRLGDLEINQDLAFERRSWQVQRVAWALFALILLAALLGLLGGRGPLSERTVGEGSPLAIRSFRFARHNSPTELTFELQPGAVPGDEARIWVNADYLDGIQVERIEPEPVQTTLAEDHITYSFMLGEAGASGRIVLHLTPQSLGWHEVRAGLEGGAEHRFTQFVYP